MDALRFPDDFPPTDRWNKFFIGVRWIGPDLSFFKDLQSVQGSRDMARMSEWGGGRRQEIAECISRILSKALGWRSEVFLPEDSAAVAFHGPRFDFNDPDSAFEDVVESLETDFGITVPDSFWQDYGEVNLGQLIDALRHYKAPQ